MTSQIYVFPGQGSQLKGMGGESLFGKYPDLVDLADEVLGYSIKELCLNDPENKLNNTEYTQPALFFVNALMYNYQKQIGSYIEPTYLMGHSLGEYNALLAAEAFDLLTGLNIVKMRGKLMSNIHEGGMTAVIGLDFDALERFLKQNDFSSIDIANINTKTQVVISGPKEDLNKAQLELEKANAMCFPLKVSGSFHSRYMKGIAKDFKDYLLTMKISNPTIGVVSNFTAKEYMKDQVVENLTMQLYNPVKWYEQVRFCLNKNDCNFTEIGPGTVLTGLINKILKS